MKGATYLCVWRGVGECQLFFLFALNFVGTDKETPTAPLAAGLFRRDLLFCASKNMYLPHISHIHASIHLHNFPEGIKKVVVELLFM